MFSVPVPDGVAGETTGKIPPEVPPEIDPPGAAPSCPPLDSWDCRCNGSSTFCGRSSGDGEADFRIALNTGWRDASLQIDEEDRALIMDRMVPNISCFDNKDVPKKITVGMKDGFYRVTLAGYESIDGKMLNKKKWNLSRGEQERIKLVRFSVEDKVMVIVVTSAQVARQFAQMKRKLTDDQNMDPSSPKRSCQQKYI